MKVYPSDVGEWSHESPEAESNPKLNEAAAAIPRAESLEEADILGRIITFVVDLIGLLGLF